MAPRAGLEPATQRLTVVCSTTELPRNRFQLNILFSAGRASRSYIVAKWWAVQDSNLRPPVCKTDALPTELTAP